MLGRGQNVLLELKPGAGGGAGGGGRWMKKAKKSMWVKDAELAFEFLSMVLSEPQHTAGPKSSGQEVHLSTDVPES